MPAGDRAFWSDVSLAAAKPMVRLVQVVVQSLAHATNTDILFGAGSEELDTHGFHDTATNPARVTPNVPGWYRCRGHVHIAAGANNLTQLVVGLAKNGGRVPPQDVFRPDPSTAAGSSSSEALVSFNGSTDYVTLVTQQQNSGATARDTSIAAPFQSTLEVVWERPL